MKFTTEFPKKSGWFWAKGRPQLLDETQDAMLVFVDENLEISNGIVSYAVEKSGFKYWAGPVLPPGEGDDSKYEKLFPIDEWHEDKGNMIWWRVPICEPPFVGTPLDSDWPTLSGTNGQDWATHFSLLPEVDQDGIQVSTSESLFTGTKAK